VVSADSKNHKTDVSTGMFEMKQACHSISPAKEGRYKHQWLAGGSGQKKPRMLASNPAASMQTVAGILLINRGNTCNPSTHLHDEKVPADYRMRPAQEQQVPPSASRKRPAIVTGFLRLVGACMSL
jgi:hypothetical protein